MKISLSQWIGNRQEILPTIPNVHPFAQPTGAKLNLFDRRPVGPPVQNVSFSGRGFVPDYISDHGYTTLPEASRTTLENEGVHGRGGMMPPVGPLPPAQLGQKTDTGSGGAGSFATRGSYKNL